MIYLGTDIVPISRINSLINNRGSRFLNHIFSKVEQEYCESKISTSIHYSGKFAAKEAVKKAILSYKSIIKVPLKCIEIKNDINGIPCVSIQHDIWSYNELKVSISHSGNYATATAILEII